MIKSKIKMLQLAVTLSACAFLLVPTILSVIAGLTVNYFKGISSGLTLKWVYQVWELYARKDAVEKKVAGPLSSSGAFNSRRRCFIYPGVTGVDFVNAWSLLLKSSKSAFWR